MNPKDIDHLRVFPQQEWDFDQQEYLSHGGMELRDYFAAKAMQGMMSDDNEYEEEVLRRENYEEFCVLIAESAYTMADVMMRVREK